MNYKRPLQASLLDHLSRPVTVIHAIIGPRQAGKTTIARQIQDSIGTLINRALPELNKAAKDNHRERLQYYISAD